ncbi:MAG: hypothetical protein IT331_12675 [Anaerolineae bacterium]|nr:hypothetical protein [Anaerolineae bacterium]
MSQVIQLSLDDLGRILVPARLREKLLLSPGMTLIVEPDNEGGVRLRIQRQEAVLVQEDGILVARGEPLTDLDNIARNARDERVTELVERTGL